MTSPDNTDPDDFDIISNQPNQARLGVFSPALKISGPAGDRQIFPASTLIIAFGGVCSAAVQQDGPYGKVIYHALLSPVTLYHIVIIFLVAFTLCFPSDKENVAISIRYRVQKPGVQHPESARP